jgi:surfactin synthase thioesterase subunit
MYVQWARVLAEDLELFAVQLPARETRREEPPYTRFFPLIDALTDALQPWLVPPFVLFGHSMGALLAFELTRELRRRDWPLPVRLLLSGRQAPTIPDQGLPIQHLPDAEFVAQLTQRYGGIPEPILRDPDFLQLFLPTLRADFDVLASYVYRPEPPLPCPISAYCGRRDQRVRSEALMDWRWQTTEGFETRWFEGDHFYFQTDRKPVLQAIQADVQALLT